jgi:hypothetical protein
MQLAAKLRRLARKLAAPFSALAQHPRVRRLVRLYLRHAPGFWLLVFAAPVPVLIVLDLAFAGVHKPLQDWAEGHKVAGDLLWHVLVAAAVAAAAVYGVLGRKRQKALRSYRRSARDEPAEFVEWSRGETPVIRLGMCQRLGDAIRRSGERPAVGLLQGRPGTGRTSCIVGLVQELAKHKMIPIPVLAKRDGSFEIEDLAREKFCKHVDRVVSSGEQADAIWHRARSTRDIVVLVDGLDDEIIGKLKRDGGKGFQKTIKGLLGSEIAVVLATTGELPLGNITPVREDLHIFTREETGEYLQTTLKSDADRKAAWAALEKCQEPVDGFLMAPFYVDLVVRLQKAGLSLEGLPRQTDRWRAGVLKRYLNGVRWGQIGIEGAEPRELRSRGQAALNAAEKVASKLKVDDADRLSVRRKALKVDDLALRDAEDLNLLWRGDATVGFASEDLGAYLATKNAAPAQLLDDVFLVAGSDDPRNRRDRYVRSSLIFWHLRHPEDRVETFEEFLERLKGCDPPRPSVLLAAVRLVCACTQLDRFAGDVADATESCVDLLDKKDARVSDPHELLGLVRALAGWPHKRAHELLWRLATSQNLEIEWWAAKALAIADGEPAQSLKSKIRDAISVAKDDTERKKINRLDDDDGQKLASLAWVLPSLREDPEAVECRFSSLREVCLDGGTLPLRGEMALAQGLKLAILNGRVVRANVDLVRELLFERSGLRFWHARLVLVHALLAHVWDQPEEAQAIRVELDGLLVREDHPLVRRGIEFAIDGLLALEPKDHAAQKPSKYKYMWSHERDAVKWVEQGKDALAQLAADVVLLSNMTYRLWEDHDEAERAREIAASPELPPCIRKSSDRSRIDKVCERGCDHGLCRAAAEKAVLAGRAQFSASFCRDQARLVGESGTPCWVRRTYRRKQHLKDFWDTQANLVQDKAHGNGNGATPASATAATSRGAQAQRVAAQGPS